MAYSYLWVDDRQEFLRQFLQYGHVLTAEEIENAGEEGVPPSPPTLAQFKEQVDTYEMLYDEVEQLSVRSKYVASTLFVYSGDGIAVSFHF